MSISDAGKAEIGVLGKGSLVDLMIQRFSNAGLSVNVLRTYINDPACSNVRIHSSVAHLVGACPIIITIMSDIPELENIFFGDEGIAWLLRAGNVVIDMSSVSPEFLQELFERLVEKEISFLDAVVINENEGEFGTMKMILVGGELSVYRQVLPIFKKIAKSVKHIGLNGASQFYRQAFAVRRKTNGP